MTDELSPGAIAEAEMLAAGYGLPVEADIPLFEGFLGRIRNGAWLQAQSFPPLRYHLPRVIPEGFTLLVGPPKIGKSWFVLALGLAAATGGRALGLTVDPGPVLYLALEDGDRRMQDRCHILLGDDHIPKDFEYVTDVEPGMVLVGIRAWLAEQALDTRPPLVILDTLGAVMPPAAFGDTTYSRDYRIGRHIKAVADSHPGVAFLVNHHDRKAVSEDFVEKVSGTNGLAGAADTIVVLARPRQGQAGLLQVTGRDVTEGEYAVTFDGTSGLWGLEGADLDAAARAARSRRADGGSLGDISVEVIEFIDDHPDGVRAREVEAELGESARRYLSRLVAAGRIRRLARGKYGPVVPPSQPSQVSQINGTTGQDGQGYGESELPSDDNRDLYR